ncbi:MAG: antibiotic biosynthesis monooxygenase family protein [Actinomycetota bacterium]
MLTARVRVTATDEGRDTLVNTLTTEAGRVRSLFDGCELFVVSVDTADPNVVMIAEEWASKEHFEAYTGSAHFAEIMGAAAPTLAAPPDSAYYESERVGP